MVWRATPLQEVPERSVVALAADDESAKGGAQVAAATPDPGALQSPSGARILSVFSMHLRALVTTMRPRQWVNNLFVAAPVLFAKQLFDAVYLGRAAAAFFLFCLLSGAVYIINDLVDVEKD